MRSWPALLFLLAVAACGGSRSPSGEIIELIYASPYSPNHPFSQADRDWMDWVAEQAAGRVRIRPIWAGALISADQSMIELRHGVADIGLIAPIYAKGGAHLLRTQTGFYSGITTQESQIALYRCLERSRKEVAAELAGLKVLAVQGGNLPVILTRDRPVRRLEDLSGLRIRAPTELLPVMRALGAEPVSLPMGEVYSALAKGILDGVIAPTDTFRSLHFAEVTHYYASLQIPRGAYPARAIGLERWHSLPKDVQGLLEDSIPVWEAALIRRTTQAVDSGAEYGIERGMKETVLPPEDQAAFLETYSRYAEEIAAGLGRFGIDGLAIYRTARASIAPDGTVNCREDR
ncbi:MAG TPA: TRAP transporter substrate-binding protein DctP [Woeseiaceae bacterium]|nr:TRAP transporter substrate-binding protein DctP [Woeseiaceae bacterium]